jgi:predicted PurR-regulated permease PerM
MKDFTDAKVAFPRLEQFAQLTLALLIVVGCGLVLQPFLPALLFSTAIAVSTWPAHQWLLRRLHGWRVAASLLSCLLVTAIVVTPTALLMMSLRDGAIWLLSLLNQWNEGGQPQLPAWIAELPVVGEPLHHWWTELGRGDSGIEKLFANFAEPAQRMALASGRALGNGMLQVFIAAILLFFLYRDGEALGRRVQAAAGRLGGGFGRELLSHAQQTVSAIMFSVIGAALAQATVATLGFWIAGVPNPFLLGALTFALSIVPVGPPLIWGGAALWLFQQAQPGWALFIVVYGFFGISSIDNVLKPFLISRSSSLPFALTLIGVIGGLIAFGVAGVFLGPVLLALAIDFFSRRLAPAGAAESAEPADPS